MRRSTVFAGSAFAVLAPAVFWTLGTQPVRAQGSAKPDLSLSVVGIGVKDYGESLNFYTKIMGFRPAFSFNPVGTKRTFTYLQVSRNTFLELQEMPPGTPPGPTHIHMETSNSDAVIAGLRKAGVAPCTETLKTGCANDPRTAQPTQERTALFVDPSGIRIEPTQLIPGSLTRKAVDAWSEAADANKMRLLVVGIAVNDYPGSENFYRNLVGFTGAFQFGNPGRITTYYQISRDSFLEMQSANENVPPGITHIHLQTADLNATIARLRTAGLASAARNTTAPNTVTEPGVTQPSNVKSANVFDPNGVRLELNELLPDSLTKKAMDSWK